MNATAYLALYLHAPLQSWGYQSRFDRRTSLSYPTRSGITGLLCAAMGIDRNDTAALAGFTGLAMTMCTYAPGMRFEDFHTVGGGYNPGTERQCMARKADGGTPQTVVTQREYLHDARFGVIVTGARDALARMESALRHPVWGIWLGRKSCIPAVPVCQGLFDVYDDAMARLDELGGRPARRTVVEAPVFADGDDTIMDTPVSFAERTFTPRRIRTIFPEQAADADL